MTRSAHRPAATPQAHVGPGGDTHVNTHVHGETARGRARAHRSDTLEDTRSRRARVGAVPSPSPTPGPPRLTRRGLLVTATGALAVATGCTSTGTSGAGGVRRPAEPDPDIALAAEALADRRAALDAIAATTDRHPQLSDVLAATVLVLENHAHLLADAVPGSAGAGPRPSGGPGGSPAAGAGHDTTPAPGRARPVPRDQARALAAEAAAQRTLATATKRHAFAAESGAFARLLGSMAAAATQQAVRLEESGADRQGAR